MGEKAIVRPGGLLPIAIIALILGIFGVLGSIFALATPLILDVATELVEQMPDDENTSEADRRAREEALKALEVGRETMGWNMAFGAFGLIAGGMLAVGAIAVLARKTEKILAAACLFAAVFCAVRFLLGLVFMQLPAMNAADADGQEQLIQIAGLIVGGLIVAGLIAFYLVSWYYLRRDTVRLWFASVGR